MSTERWLPIRGHDGYDVSDRGRVRSRDRVLIDRLGRRRRWRGRVLSTYIEPRGGYEHIDLQGRTTAVHALVLTAFVSARPPGQHGCHRNGRPSDNRLTNLRWDTVRGNQLDSVAHGTHNFSRRQLCPLGHVLLAPNVRRDHQAVGYRSCLSCSRARAYCRKHPDVEVRADADRRFVELVKSASRAERIAIDRVLTSCPGEPMLEPTR